MSETLYIESWKVIPGYEGLYEVSDLGRVKSLDRTRGNHHNSVANIKGKLRSDHLLPLGYMQSSLCKDGVHKQHLVHKLVMLAFVGPMPEGCECVMHKNDIRNDNRLSNLRYGTNKENVQDAKQKGRLIDITKYSIRGAAAASDVLSKPVVATHIKTGETVHFKNVNQASIILSLRPANIYSVCSGKRKRVGQYSFKQII